VEGPPIVSKVLPRLGTSSISVHKCGSEPPLQLQAEKKIGSGVRIGQKRAGRRQWTSHPGRYQEVNSVMGWEVITAQTAGMNPLMSQGHLCFWIRWGSRNVKRFRNCGV